MQKLFLFLLSGFFLIFSSCDSKNRSNEHAENIKADNVSIFPVISFLKGQLRIIDSLPTTPLKLVISHGKTDSIWLKRDEVRSDAAPFLTPQIDSVSMSSFFSEKSFLDQTINAFTFSYDPKAVLPDSLHLTHWDVYINPQTGEIQRVYLVKETVEDNKNITTQLTWVTDGWYSIRTITQKPGTEPDIKEEKMIWNFD